VIVRGYGVREEMYILLIPGFLSLSANVSVALSHQGSGSFNVSKKKKKKVEFRPNG
jgi:hypothetical protein